MTLIDTTRTIQFFAPGEPQPQPRPRATIRYSGGKPFASVYNPTTADAWKQSITLHARALRLDSPLAGPLKLSLAFHLPRPGAHYGTGRNASMLKPTAPEHHTGKPDIDNLSKAVMDALTGCEVWGDDAKVCRLIAGKSWCAPGSGGCWITIEELQ